ncbi:MAG: hypothetical protein F6J94_05945 [Moorea sp. SIO1F2]|uniref:putative Ig domain-containing protein n=1 Tax=Moorena sp. SIO1F2 TaxID=2607819 RepID=UPI0013BA94C6|nr:putative Ig domain-containing protein [Moorena sp. SIO1F2]NET81510.1 hypothetical protein [Moorena sp. SIO1F2]
MKKIRIVLWAALLSGAMLMIPQPAQAIESIIEPVSHFDTGTEGWSVVDVNDQEVDPEQSRICGFITGGYIHNDDQVGDGPYDYVAPEKFVGDKSSFFNGNLRFAVEVNLENSDQITEDINSLNNSLINGLTISGLTISGGGLELQNHVSTPTIDQWTPYTIPLNAEGGWIKTDSNEAATNLEIMQVLTDLDYLKINGDWFTNTNKDRSSLDEVRWEKCGSLYVYEPPNNSAPVVTNPIGAQTINENESFTLTIGEATFSDTDGDSLSLSATIPSWLDFDGTTFSGTPSSDDIGTTTITVTASDELCKTVSDAFELQVNHVPVRTEIANSVEDFSDTQGEHNWFYGYYDGSLTSADFHEMQEYTEGSWKVKQGKYWTELSNTIAHPNGPKTTGRRKRVEQWGVRRWVSDIEGEVTFKGHLAKKDSRTASDGVIAYIFVDGTKIWSDAIHGNDGVGVYFTVSSKVQKGSVVDFALAPGNSDFFDKSTFTISIIGLL